MSMSPLGILLNTPIFNFAAARAAGSSLLFVAGLTFAYHQQQVQGTLPSLNQRCFKVLETGLAITALFFVVGAPFTTTLPSTLAYALLLMLSGGFGLANALANDPNRSKLIDAIMRAPENTREYFGIHPDMGYILLHPPQKNRETSEPASYDLQGHVDENYRIYALNPNECNESEIALLKESIQNQPHLFPTNRSTSLVQIQGGNAYIFLRPFAVLPKSLPEETTITADDISEAQSTYKDETGIDLGFLKGKSVQNIEQLGELIVKKDALYRMCKHNMGAHLWRHLCAKYLPFTDETAHPIDPSIIVRKKTA